MGTYDISAVQGSTYTLAITWRDDDENPIDLTDYSASLQVRGPSNKLRLSLSTGDGITIADPLSGHIDILIDAETMASIKAGVYRYDLELTNGTFATKLLRGDFKVSGEVAL